MFFSIPEMNMESLEKKLTRIQNKAIKYGSDFKYERIGEHFKDVTMRAEDIDGETHKWTETIKYIDIEVDGIAAVNGWEFAASLEFTDKGNIIRSTGNVEIPKRYYSCAPWCEHCKTARDRKHSYIVYSKESGEFKQVGKACLKDFTGGLSAEAVAQFESFIKEAEDAQDYRNFSGHAKSYFKVDDFMATAAETIRLFGYTKRDGYNIATADRAEELYRDANDMYLPMTDAVRARLGDAKSRGFDAKRSDAVSLAKDVRAWIANSERDDNYFHNLKVACGNDWVDYKGLGLLVSAFPAYNRELEYEAKRREQEARDAESRAKSSYMGNVGDKVSFQIADFRTIASWTNNYGAYVCVYKFVSADGLEATWKTSSDIDYDTIIGSVISGTVKEHKEYNGIKQTELTRCKITKGGA